MRIALNAQLLYFGESYRAAGISRYIAGLLQGVQASTGPDRFTAFTGNQAPPEGFWHAAGFRSQAARLPTDRPLVRILWEQIVQPWALAGCHAELLHSLAFVSPLAWRGPTVVTIYDLSFLRYPERFNAANRLYLTAMTGRSARQARRVVAISQSTKDDVVRLLGVPADRVDVVRPSLESRFQPPAAAAVAAFRAQRGLPERFILFTGTLEPRKNLGTLLEAYAASVPPVGDLPLVIAGGKGWFYRTIFETVQRLGLEKRVLFPGFVSSAELPLWYGAADLFVYPSVYEGFGLPVLEALACGTPVVCSNTSSLPEAAGDAALLVDPADPAALAAGISRLLTDESLRREMRQRGLAHAAAFSQAEMGRRMLDVYHKA
jgi:glycosyltransferase involved in cell wall biosynthesis